MDFIPLKVDENSLKRASGPQSSIRKKKKLIYAEVFDKQLLPRVRQYLEENKDKVYIDIEDITNDLRQKYPEYSRKQVKPFMRCVEQAYTKVKRDLALSCNSELNDIDFEETIQSVMDETDIDNDVTIVNTSLMNETVVSGNTRAVDRGKNQKPKPKSRSMPNMEAVVPKITFSDFGGNEKCLEDLCKLLVHLKHPEAFLALGITPPHGILLHGPPGSGKTLLANAMAGELKIPLIKLGATEIVSGVSGESEEKLREVFQKAKESAPCLLFLDEIDAICPPRQTAQREMERRIVAQLLSSMDDLNQKEGPHVLVVGATNRPDSLDPALRRAGRFDRELSLGIPNETDRKRILKVICQGIRVGEDVSYKLLARLTPGYVGADLRALIREASMIAVDRIFSEGSSSLTENKDGGDSQSDEDSTLIIIDSTGNNSLNGDVNKVESEKSDKDRIGSFKLKETGVSSHYRRWIKGEVTFKQSDMANLAVSMEDFTKATKVVQPSAKREGFATIPNITWQDVGALKEVKEELRLAIMAPIMHGEQCERLGLKNPSGILLCGPPGCGKTMLAKAVSNEAGINFISVKGPELLNMYVGESERAVRQCFQRAKNSAPCVIFFDEIDSLCPRRSDSSENASSSRLVNQMLTEMDGMEGRTGVYLMAATNRLDVMDPAVLRPGRLDKIIYVGLPSPKERVDVLKTITKDGTQPPLAENISLEDIGEDPHCEGFTGADLSALVREASMFALREYLTCGKNPKVNVTVEAKHFVLAFGRIRASVSSKELRRYAHLSDYYSIAPPLKEASPNNSSNSLSDSLRCDNPFKAPCNEPDEITLD